MPRIALSIEYDGTGFNGWQAQKDGRCVQTIVEAALSRVADQACRVVCAGRTDAGVHAAGQVVHFDTRAERGDLSWVLGVNALLPDDVSAVWAKPVTADFHARYSALNRTYRYLILNRRTRSALYRHRACWIHRSLDEDAMAEAAPHLLGEHNFNAYRTVHCQARNPVRRVSRLQVWRHGDFITMEITANAFLHHMVRNIAGVLIRIGRGDEAPGWAREVLEGRDRSHEGITAPAHGLCFVTARYPDKFGLPETGGGQGWRDSSIMPGPEW